MSQARQRALLTAGLTAVVASSAISAMTLGPAARRMPLVVAVPTLALLAIEWTRHTRGAGTEGDDKARSLEATTFAWLGGLLAGIWVLGMLAGLPLFLAAYLRARSGEPWVVTLGMALGVWAVLLGVLDHALGIQMYPGLMGMTEAWGP